jgi:hypothetical protein
MDLIDHLKLLGPRLPTVKGQPTADIFYEAMTGGLVWTDETICLKGATVEEIGCLRILWRYRTSLILQNPDSHCEALWNQARRDYPEWIGFDSARCTPDEELVALYEKQSKKTARALNTLLKMGVTPPSRETNTISEA